MFIQKTIFVVENDFMTARLLTQLISEECGYHVIIAPDCLSTLQNVHAYQPDLFILDHYPPKVQSIKLIDHLHQHDKFRRVPFLVLSTDLPYEDLISRGIVGMEKPFDLDDLLHCIDHLLESGHSTPKTFYVSTGD